MKLLIVEDNLQLSENITSFLSREDYVCEVAKNYAEAINKLVSFTYDVIILDIMLPDADGFKVIEYVKKHNIESGILIVSAKDSLDDKIKGLDFGADDYLTKPFHLTEMHSRLRAIYRRRNFQGNKEIVFNEISINTDTHEVFVNHNPIVLTKKEYELLLYLLANKNRILTKQSIAEHLWGDYMDVYDSYDFVYQHIKNLRKKLTHAGAKDYIATLYGVGYKFNSGTR